ncbi:MAG: substrate-binding domain-containing protein, partial [Chloroflexota bacterium]
PQAVNVDSDFYTWGFEMADAIGNEIGEGNVLVIEGLAGAPIVADQALGRNAALANYPGLNVVATVNGDWNPTTTKTVVLQTLATNPAEIDAVWTSGSEARLVTEAFVEAGRDVPLVTGSITGDNLGYWNENPDGYRFTGHAVLPVPAAQSGFRVAMRILQGQEPKLNTMLVPFPPVSQDQLGDWFSECFTSDSGSLFPVAASDPYPDELLDAYFTNPGPTPPYDYATTPDPCG